MTIWRFHYECSAFRLLHLGPSHLVYDVVNVTTRMHDKTYISMIIITGNSIRSPIIFAQPPGVRIRSRRSDIGVSHDIQCDCRPRFRGYV